MCDTIFKNYDIFSPPPKDTVNLLQGVNDFQNNTLHNMSDVWYKLTLKTKNGDIMLLGGDFILACSECCFKNDKNCLETTNPDDKKLINLMVKKLKEGVKIIMLDDLIFVQKLFKSVEPQYNYITTTLKQNSNGNFYHYTIPLGNRVSLHSKIVTVFYLSDTDPYLVSSMGSFNPSYPVSRTAEIGLFVTGLTKNPLIQAIGSYMWVIANYIFSIKNYSENWGNNEPLNTISKHFNVKGNYKRDIYSNINFCGKNFCPNSSDRIIFTEKNVKFRIGGEPTIVFGKQFDYGLDLIKNLFNNSKKYVKIGIMQGVVEQLPYCSNKICKDEIIFDTLLFNEELMKFLKNGKGLYIMQKKPKKTNKDGTFGPWGGLWDWLKYNGKYCKDICYKTPLDKGIDGPKVIEKNPVSIRWYNSPLHWKLYFSDNEIIQSTQHPIAMFYSGTKTEATMGYELSIKNCPKLIAYYDNLYNYYWKNYTFIPKFDKQSPDILPCGSSFLNKNNCCQMDGIRCVSSCYTGGEGPPLRYNILNNKCVKSNNNPRYYTLSECENMLKSKSNLKSNLKSNTESESKKNSEIFIIVIIICVAILLLVSLYFIFKNEKTFNSKKYKKYKKYKFN